MNWASKKICFRFGKDSQYPAYVTGRSVTMSHEWFKAHPDDLGCMIHELFHIVQGGYHNAPDWLTEGIADYVRFYLYEPEAHGCDMVLRSDDVRYDGKYRVSANFLDFVERRHPGVVKELNALCRQGKYDEGAYWKKRTGKTVKELEKEWKRQGDGPFSHYRFCVDRTKSPAYCTQLSEIALLDANNKVIPCSEFKLSFKSGDGVFGDGETPDKAVDGDVAALQVRGELGRAHGVVVRGKFVHYGKGGHAFIKGRHSYSVPPDSRSATQTGARPTRRYFPPTFAFSRKALLGNFQSPW